jgi:hypothetical protein
MKTFESVHSPKALKSFAFFCIDKYNKEFLFTNKIQFFVLELIQFFAEHQIKISYTDKIHRADFENENFVGLGFEYNLNEFDDFIIECFESLQEQLINSAISKSFSISENEITFETIKKDFPNAFNYFIEYANTNNMHHWLKEIWHLEKFINNIRIFDKISVSKNSETKLYDVATGNKTTSFTNIEDAIFYAFERLEFQILKSKCIVYENNNLETIKKLTYEITGLYKFIENLQKKIKIYQQNNNLEIIAKLEKENLELKTELQNKDENTKILLKQVDENNLNHAKTV